MNKAMRFFIEFLILFVSVKSHADIPKNLKCLWVAYPVFKIDSNAETIQFNDGTQMPYPDRSGLHPKKDFDKIVENVTSLEQMFLIPYFKGFQKDKSGHLLVQAPVENDDPGRLRYEAFFKKIYGDSESATRANQIQVKWAVDNTSWSFNKKFGAAQALTAVALDLVALVHEKPEMKQYLVSPLGGTYGWRPIAGTKNLSFHSFGVAIDINTTKTDYWRWDIAKEKTMLPKFRNRIPAEIAQVFESHGFIWGGKWSHYDTMHFEYRPELMLDQNFCEQKFSENYH